MGLATPRASSNEAIQTSHLRGSNLLLVGRILAIAVNLAVQVLTVRHLSKEVYGAFAWAFSIATLGSTVALLGLNRSVSRFLPIYQERGDHARMLGSVLLSLGTVLATGGGLVLLAHVLGTSGLQRFEDDPLAISLLLVQIVLVPLQALDHVFQSLLAVFGKARALFVRRHVLGPLLRLAAVAAVVVLGGNALHLSWGYVVGAALGLVAAVWSVWDWGGGRQGWSGAVILPARELATYSAPLFTSDLLFVLRMNLPILFLKALRESSEVAEFRAVLPIAVLNLVVLQSMALLFTPSASRLLARNDSAGLNGLFWSSAAWISMLTFPVFAVTCFLADDTAVILFGHKYANAGPVLAVLALGHYFHAALGLKMQLLEVQGRLRSVFWINIAVTLLALVANYVLIGRFGSIGAAWALTLVLVVQNIASHACLAVGNAGLLSWSSFRAYLWIAVAGAAAFALTLLPGVPFVLQVALLALVSLALIWVNRSALAIGRVFPELSKIPGVRRFLGQG